MLYAYTVFLQEVLAMARYDDKITALNRSITHEPSGRQVVRTSVFVRNLAHLNHALSLVEANRWITFRDASTEEDDDKLWFQFNPNGGLYRFPLTGDRLR
jgi:hypothetical protein